LDFKTLNLHLPKIDITSFYIRANQLHPESITDIFIFKAICQPALDWKMQQANPSAFVCGAGNDRF